MLCGRRAPIQSHTKSALQVQRDDLQLKTPKSPLFHPVITVKKRRLRCSDLIGFRSDFVIQLLLTPHQSWFDKNLMWNFGPLSFPFSSLGSQIRPHLLKTEAYVFAYVQPLLKQEEWQKSFFKKRKKRDLCVFALLT